MNNWYESERMIEERRKEIAGYLEQQQLAKAASASAPHRSGWSDRFLAWLGGRMEQTGHRLREHHTLEPCHGDRSEKSFA